MFRWIITQMPENPDKNIRRKLKIIECSFDVLHTTPSRILFYQSNGYRMRIHSIRLRSYNILKRSIIVFPNRPQPQWAIIDLSRVTRQQHQHQSRWQSTISIFFARIRQSFTVASTIFVNSSKQRCSESMINLSTHAPYTVFFSPVAGFSSSDQWNRQIGWTRARACVFVWLGFRACFFLCTAAHQLTNEA